MVKFEKRTVTTDKRAEIKYGTFDLTKEFRKEEDAQKLFPSLTKTRGKKK